MDILLKEKINNKNYKFKNVETGTLFKVDNELCLKVSNIYAFNIDYGILEYIAPKK